MIIDYSDDPTGINERRMQGGKVIVNGKEIRACFYIDTEKGIVKSYDVHDDGRFYLNAARNAPDYKTLEGEIVLIDKDGIEVK